MTASHYPLAGRVVGISISESPDLRKLGFDETRLTTTLSEVADAMLAAGATLAYGGDLRADGFTQTLCAVVRAHQPSDGHDAKRIRNYVAWPLYHRFSAEQQAKLEAFADVRTLAAPSVPGLDTDAFLPPDDARCTYAWCLSLTRMRRQLAHDNDAQIQMGGRLSGYTGKYPGLVEEAYEMMRAEKPLYLIGAFGGCTGAVIEAIRGNRPEALTHGLQSQDEGYRAAMQYFNQHAPPSAEPIDYESLIKFFHDRGLDGLNNGLTLAENERLFSTDDVAEVNQLVLRGLSAKN